MNFNIKIITSKIHFFSGIILSVFIAFHLFNHAISVIGVEEHLVLMNKIRILYRNILVESILLLSVLVQIFTGIKLFLNKKEKIKTRLEKLHLWTSLYLVFSWLFTLALYLWGGIYLI